MEISGKIVVACNPRGGVSQRTGNAWKMQEFVIETHEQYPRKCMFSVFGEDRLKEFNIQVGDELTVSFDIDAREYNGRWYNDLRAWRVQRGAAPVQAPATAPAGGFADAGSVPSPNSVPNDPLAQAASGNASSDATEDDLPF